MLIVFSSEECGLVEVAALSAHGYGSVKVEFEISRRANELFEFLNVFEFRITIEQEGSVIWRCTIMLMKFFQVVNEVMNPLGIEKLWPSATASLCSSQIHHVPCE